jgi:hypothetical protein
MELMNASKGPYLLDAMPRERATAALQVAGCGVSARGDKLAVDLAHHSASEVNQLLVSQGVAVSALIPPEPDTLEGIVLRMTRKNNDMRANGYV